jgi:hypothetical protein
MVRHVVARTGSGPRPEPIDASGVENALPSKASQKSAQAISALRPQERRRLLLREGDKILRQARCDALTGEKKDRKYKAKRRDEKRARREREKRFGKSDERLGKLGAASRARRIAP